MIVIDGPAIVGKSDTKSRRDGDGVLIACQTCAHYLIFTPEALPVMVFEHCQKGHEPCDACDEWVRCDTGCDKTACPDCWLTEIEGG